MTIKFSQLQDLYLLARPPKREGDVLKFAVQQPPRVALFREPGVDELTNEDGTLIAVMAEDRLRWTLTGVTVLL